MYTLEELEAAFLVEEEPKQAPVSMPGAKRTGSAGDGYSRRLASLYAAHSARYERCLNGDHDYPSDSEASMAVVDAMVARHFSDSEIWLTLEASTLYGRRAERKGEKHARELYASEIEKARATVQQFERDPGTVNGSHARVPTSDDQDARPEIITTNRWLRDLAAEAWQAVRLTNEPAHLFQHGNGIVEVRFDEEEHRTVLHHLDKAALKGVLDRAADWLKETRTGIFPARPPTDVVEDMLAGLKPLPSVRGIVGTPTVSAQGLIVTTQGYQTETRLYYAPEGDPVHRVSSSPEPDEVAKALALIEDEWLGEFPFIDQASRANTIAAALTPLVREITDGPTPMIILDAPAPGTGKGLLSETVADIVCGASPGIMNDTRNEEEMRKRITSLLKEGTSVALIDNVKYEMNSSTLAALLTSTVWVDRQMGVNLVLRLPNRALWMATGNNVKLSNEIARRSVWVRLDSKVDRPWEREGFRHPQLRSWVKEHRHELVWALLTLIQKWIATGRPTWDGKLLGSYESWSQIVGGILRCAGIDGFMANRDELYRRADTETEEWRAFTQAWWEMHGPEPVKTGDLLPLVKDEGLLPSISARVKDGAGDRSFSTRLGTALSAARDRRYGSYFIRHVGADGHAKVSMYRLEAVEDAGPSTDNSQGPAEVPHENEPIPDSNAVRAVPAGPVFEAGRQMKSEEPPEEDHDSVLHPNEVPQVPQVPRTDSNCSQKPAGPVGIEGVQVPHEVPQESLWQHEVPD